MKRQDQLILRVLVLHPLGFIIGEVYFERHRRPMREAQSDSGTANWLI